MVFTTIVELAFRLLLWVLKYTFTLLLKVFEKPGFMSLENFGLSMLWYFLFDLYYFKKNIKAINSIVA